MSIKAHRITNCDDIYFEKMWEIYTTSFPIVEQRSYEDHKAALTNVDFYCMVYFEEKLSKKLDEKNKKEEVIATLCYWELEHFSLIEFFAVDQNMRGKSFGKQIIKECITHLKNIPVLEIEVVCDDITTRRWNFYKQLDFKQNNEVYMHPPYQKGFERFPLTILSYQRELTKEEYELLIYEEKKKQLYYTYYKGELL